jgi:hypothetical protein
LKVLGQEKLVNLAVLELSEGTQLFVGLLLYVKLHRDYLHDEFPLLSQHFYLISVAVDEVASLGVQAWPLHHDVCDELGEADQLKRVRAVLIGLQVVMHEQHLLILEITLLEDEVKGDLTSVDGAGWLTCVDISQVLGLVDVVGSDFDKLLFNFEHIVECLLVDDFDTELIIHSDFLGILINLPLVLLTLGSLDSAVSGEIPSLELPRNLLI